MRKAFFRISFLVVFLSFSNNYAQDKIDQKILDQSCNCIKKIKLNLEKESKIDSVNSCITQSILTSQMENITNDLSKILEDQKGKIKDTTYISNKNINITLDKDFDIIQKNCLWIVRVSKNY